MEFSSILHVAARNSGLPPWSPLSLGASLLGWWDAEQSASLTLNGSGVSGWADQVAGYSAIQATSGFRPLYSATSYNGRPGITFDGTDDFLAIASSPFVLANANNMEIWFLGSSTTAGSVATTKIIISCFGDNAANCLRLRRIGTGGVSQGGASMGQFPSSGINCMDTGVDFIGNHVLRAVYSSTQVQVSVDGDAFTTQAATLGVQAGNFAIGSTSAGANNLQGVMNSLLVTSHLSAPQATALVAYLKARGGIP